MRAQDILPDGVDQVEVGDVTVRKGSVGAFLANAALLRDAALSPHERAEAVRDIEDVVPALRALGLFDVFEIRDPALRAIVEAR